VAPDPFQPYAIAAVELAEERMVVLGQVAPGFPTSALEVGMRMDLVADPLYADDEHEYLVWKWRPAGRGRPMNGGTRSRCSGSACTPGASGAGTSSSTASKRRRMR
jgi:hypothetical protein